MARPREFDRAKAVRSAMDLFWDLGYEQASTAALEKRMGIGRSSLYAAFGSKDELYAEALDKYIHDLRDRVIAPLNSAGPAMDVLRDFFDAITRRGEAGGKPLRCCMIVRASTSGARRSPAIAGRIDRALGELDEAFLRLLQRARDEGDLSAEAPLPDLARFLTTIFQGLNLAANAGRSRRELRDIVRPALTLVGA